MSPFIWTAELDRKIQRLRDNRISYVAIGAAVGCSETCVRQRIFSLAGTELRPKKESAERPCLCCGNKFTSAGPHNRLCLTCRRKDVSPYASF